MRKPAARVVLLAATSLPMTALAEPTHVGVPGSQILNLVGVLQESSFCGLPSQRILVRVRGTGAAEDKPFVAHERQIWMEASAWHQTAQSLPNSLEIFGHTPVSVHVSGYLARI